MKILSTLTILTGLILGWTYPAHAFEQHGVAQITYCSTIKDLRMVLTARYVAEMTEEQINHLPLEGKCTTEVVSFVYQSEKCFAPILLGVRTDHRGVMLKPCMLEIKGASTTNFKGTAWAGILSYAKTEGA